VPVSPYIKRIRASVGSVEVDERPEDAARPTIPLSGFATELFRFMGWL
jgi:hypothetical protein